MQPQLILHKLYRTNRDMSTDYSQFYCIDNKPLTSFRTYSAEFFHANFALSGAGERPLLVTWRRLERCANFPTTRSIAFAATLSRRKPVEVAKSQRMRDRRQRKVSLCSQLNLRGIPLRLRKVWPNNQGVRLDP